jgi:MFS family permease
MHTKDEPVAGLAERTPSRLSLRALDLLNVFLADVRDGMGPFVGTFLRENAGWDASAVGMALAATQMGTLVAQTPAGTLIDRIRGKRVAVVAAAAAVAAGCVVLYLLPVLPVVLAVQASIGAAAAIFPPAIAALTLGLVGRPAMAKRTGRNEAFNHGGNVAAAALAGCAAYSFGYGAMFILVAGMAVASAVAVLLISEGDIDHALARGADDGEAQTGEAVGVGELFRDRRIATFIAAVLLFHFANAAMLPLVGQKSSDGVKAGAPVAMSACIIAAQVVMVPVALLASRFATTWGRKPVFLIGFAVLPVRGLLYCLSVDPVYLVAVQLLDGMGAGIFGVVSVLVVADVTKGTGRFNLAQGAIATATGVGAGLSNLVAGFVVKAGGFDTGFVTLAAIACAGTLFFTVAMPETAPGVSLSAAAVVNPTEPPTASDRARVTAAGTQSAAAVVTSL